MLLRSDGSAVASGWNVHGQRNIPRIAEGVSYIQVSAGEFHTVFLFSDGTAVACGHNIYGQCSIPPLNEGLSYTQVSAAGFSHLASSECHTSRFQQAAFIRCFSKVTVAPLVVD